MKNVTNRVRRDRAIRFGLFGAGFGAVLVLALLAVINFVALFTQIVPFVPSTFEQLYGTVMRTLIFSMSIALVCAVIGFATARVAMRIFALRMLGVAIIAASLWFGWWIIARYSDGLMLWTGAALELVVAFMGVVVGAIMISRSRGVIIENL